MTLDRGDFCRLIFEVHEPVLVPISIWTGVTMSTIHMAIDNIVRTAGVSRRLSRCHAPDAPTKSAVAR